MKGMSTLISTVMMIVIVMSIGAFVSPWMLGLVRSSTNQTTTNIDSQLICQNADYDFDNNYGTNGILWNFTHTNSTLRAKIVNTGTINIYNFSFEITINNSLIYDVDVNSTTQRTQASPLKPGQSAILLMNATQDYNDTLSQVTVLNVVCLNKYVTQTV